MLKTFIASQFKKPSGLFGIFSSNIMIKGNKDKYEKLINELSLQPGDKLLEIGYGPGTGINMIARACPSCTVHGIDFSKLMYKRAAKFNKQYIDNNSMVLHYGDFLKTPVAGSDYDKIYCLNVIYFWDQLQEPFQKVLSLLKFSGAFYIFMADRAMLKKAPDTVFNKYAAEQVIDALRSSGFRNVSCLSEKGYYIKAIK
jgi:cyclopropane fatty-acyl-phospholipid synthase-like methyltransferase